MNWRSMAVLLAGMFLVMLGFGIILPILPFCAVDFGAEPFDVGLLMASYSTMQLLFAPLWGSLSDRVGRRPVLLCGLAGFTASFVLLGLATRLWMLYAARLLGGILSSATLPTAMAYVSDTTSEQNRGSGMGAMGAAMGLGMVFGPAVGGLLSGISIQTPFFAAAALGLINLVFGAALLPESLASARGLRLRNTGDAGREHPRSAEPKRARTSLRELARDGLPVLFAMAFLVSVGMACLQSTLALYLNAVLGYSAAEMGLVFAPVGVVGVIAQGAVVGPLIRRIGEPRVARWGLALSGVGLFLLTQVTDTATALAFTALFALGNALVRPAVSSLTSKKSGERQGAALGGMQSFDSLGRIVGPLWGGAAYAFSISLPYLGGALAMFLGLAAALVWDPLISMTAEKARI